MSRVKVWMAGFALVVVLSAASSARATQCAGVIGTTAVARATMAAATGWPGKGLLRKAWHGAKKAVKGVKSKSVAYGLANCWG